MLCNWQSAYMGFWLSQPDNSYHPRRCNGTGRRDLCTFCSFVQPTTGVKKHIKDWQAKWSYISSRCKRPFRPSMETTRTCQSLRPLDAIALSRDSDSVKLYHLDKALVGPAAGVLNAKTLNEGNYVYAWPVLTDRYEKQRMVVETYIRGLLSLKEMASRSSSNLQQLVAECTKYIESLEYQNQTLTGVSELVVVYLFVVGFDDSMKLQWEQSLASMTDLPEYKEYGYESHHYTYA